MPPKDNECATKALEGDKESFGALVDAYQGMVFAVGYEDYERDGVELRQETTTDLGTIALTPEPRL